MKPVVTHGVQDVVDGRVEDVAFWGVKMVVVVEVEEGCDVAGESGVVEPCRPIFDGLGFFVVDQIAHVLDM